MMLSGERTEKQSRQLAELIRIVELRMDAKLRELELHREAKRLRERELAEQQHLCDIADKTLNDCIASIALARVAAFVPGMMPGFLASQKMLLKSAQTRRKEVKTASKRVIEAEQVVDQTLATLSRLRAREQLLADLLQKLLKHLVVYRNLQEDTLQDDEYTSYLSAKMHWKRGAESSAA
jgi:hypothetical protein